MKTYTIAFKKVCEIIQNGAYENDRLLDLDKNLKDFFISFNAEKAADKYKNAVKDIKSYLKYASDFKFKKNFFLCQYKFDGNGEGVLGIVFVGEEYFVKAKEDMDINSDEFYGVSEEYRKYVANQEIIPVLKKIMGYID